jgi:BirA family transcriptional regulator, biotin operon repressor / biotin---[acetyl-CoA-carboxylase] ligase
VTDPIGIPRRKLDSAPSWTVWEVAETGSTNADLLMWADAGTAPDRSVLRANHQTAGRGRLDRRWDAPSGASLLASILFLDPPSVPTKLTQAVGRAALDAIETVAARDLTGRLALKWPNDLLLDGRKLSGVLAQRSVRTGAVVVGLGLNVVWAPDGAASLARDLGLAVTPDELLNALLRHLDGLLEAPDLIERYRAKLATLGAQVRAELPSGRVLIGVATDLDDDGRLLVDDGTAVVALDVGDIVHLRPA